MRHVRFFKFRPSLQTAKRHTPISYFKTHPWYGLIILATNLRRDSFHKSQSFYFTRHFRSLPSQAWVQALSEGFWVALAENQGNGAIAE